ncbi:uncharacterized protein DUF4349 [Jejuia pallidilutea]|uniref:Uncharacterized protein DUF4349 n=1 Tax=Jejuia pallidilutea TaxID=504487 RepID=A0A362X0Y2_9FLAO|nr:DUF4349 domain-containing protein [Jejuia pallidilutea]PQV49584.1 uncharacterized protein DUF4349 [Jejuia pallidilutea]
MKLFSYILVITLPLMCSSPSSKNYNYNEGAMDTEVVIEESSSINGLVSVPAEAKPQKIIKTSYLKFETQDLEKSYSAIISAVKTNNGFVQDDNSNKSYNTITRHLVIRIPTSNFQTAIDAISENVSYFDSKRISAKDVTEEFIDLEARLKAKQTLEKRYLELLNKAKNVKEILEIERELSNIREEIEAKQGRLKYLQDKVSLSTINIEFYKLTSEAPVTTSYGTKMWNAVKGGFNGISVFFLGILYVWPLIVIAGIAIFLLRRWIKKSKK